MRQNGTDLDVVNAARVSFDKESEWELYNPFDFPDNAQLGHFDADSNYYCKLSEKDTKLVNYLAKHNHWSPFAHVGASFRIKAPIFVARQLVKHQVGLVWNEVSRRYVDTEPEYFLPDSWRTRPESNMKQGSGSSTVEIPLTEYWGAGYSIVHDALVDAQDTYQKLLDAGVAPEQARMVLPQNTMTEWIWTGSLMAFARVCKLRLDSHAQAETQEIAQYINKEMEKAFPVCWKALNEY